MVGGDSERVSFKTNSTLQVVYICAKVNMQKVIICLMLSSHFCNDALNACGSFMNKNLQMIFIFLFTFFSSLFRIFLFTFCLCLCLPVTPNDPVLVLVFGDFCNRMGGCHINRHLVECQCRDRERNRYDYYRASSKSDDMNSTWSDHVLHKFIDVLSTHVVQFDMNAVTVGELDRIWEISTNMNQPNGLCRGDFCSELIFKSISPTIFHFVLNSICKEEAIHSPHIRCLM